MWISYYYTCFLLSASISALSSLSITPTDSGDSSFDSEAAMGVINPSSDPNASWETAANSVNDVDLSFADMSPQSDQQKEDTLPSPLNSVGSSENILPSPESSSLGTFETAYVQDEKSDSAKPPCSLPNSAACCIKNSMFTSCVWWGLDRIFCEDADNYACCESIQDYVGSNCEHVGEEGKDWDWLEDVLRTPIIIEPPMNPLNFLPPLPFIPERE